MLYWFWPQLKTTQSDITGKINKLKHVYVPRLIVKNDENNSMQLTYGSCSWATCNTRIRQERWFIFSAFPRIARKFKAPVEMDFFLKWKVMARNRMKWYISPIYNESSEYEWKKFKILL